MTAISTIQKLVAYLESNQLLKNPGACMTWPRATSCAQRVVLSFATSLLLLCCTSTFAQQGIDAGALQQNLQRQLPSISPLQLPTPVFTIPDTRDARADQTTTIVKRFILQGISILPETEVQSAIKPWLDRLVSFEDLQKACEAIEVLYRKNGRIVQAILPPQKVIDGAVLIEIMEGKLGSVQVDPVSGEHRFSRDRAAAYITYANPVGEPLDMNALTRAILILNETPGVSVTTALEPGSKNGETSLRMNLIDTPMLQGRLEGNNYGSVTTGTWQGVVGATLNNPLGYGDQLSASGIYAQGSQYTQAGYSFPIGLSGLRAGVSGSYLNYQNIGDFYLNGGYGFASTLSANLAYPLVRTPETNVNLTFQYDNKSYSNKNLATSAVMSEYNINDFTLGLTGNHADDFLGGGTNTASIALVAGNLSIGNSSPESYASFVDDAGLSRRYMPENFMKLTISGSRTQTLIQNKTFLQFNISGQLANANLNSAEQFYLGGPYGVRAYPVAQGGGAQGGLASIELQQDLTHGFQGIVFFDAGVVQQFRNTYPDWQGLTHAGNTYSLAGTGVGIRYQSKGVNVALQVAWQVGANPLYSQTGLPVNNDNTTTNPRGWLTVGFQL